MQATVYKSTGSWYIVKDNDGYLYKARLKGAFKIDGLTSTNPIAVGDVVRIQIEDGTENFATITEIEQRHNYITRISPHNKRQRHIVASNLDQCLLIATLRNPKTSMGFMDRFLTVCEMYHIPPIVVFNKSDIYRDKEMALFESLKTIYENIGYKVMLCSFHNNKEMEAIDQVLHNKKTLFFGHSGVGKTTLINVLLDMELKTSEVSDWSGKGLHTTTFAEMYDLPNGGAIIDTPGIRELALSDITKKELSHYFPEMRAILNDCKFNDCIHFNDKDCAVKRAVEEGSISEERFISYLNILDTIEDEKY